MINTIKAKIKEVIQDHVTEVQEVRDFNAIEFTGFPAISITLSDHENDFETTSENMRIFAYKIRCFVSIANEMTGVTEEKYQRAERVMGDLVWSIINALDDHYTLDETIDFADAVPSVWEMVNMQNGTCLMATITYKAHKSYTLQ